MSGKQRTIYRSKDGKLEITTNIPGFRRLTRDEKIAGLLEAGLIDEAQAVRLYNEDSSS